MNIFLPRSTVALLILVTWTPSLTAQAEPPTLLLSPQRSFGVPFHVAPTRHPSQAPREVFLYLSTDQGVHWQLAGRTNPEAGRFVVRTQNDGEHWFLVRTLSQDGQLSPVDPSQPGLRVLVDSAKPEVQLNSRRLPGNEILTEFYARDANLDRQQIQIEYQASVGGPWQRVPHVQHAEQDDFQKVEGHATWRSTTATESVTVRIRASDRAGNEAIAQEPVADPPRSAPTQTPHDVPTLPGSATNTRPADTVSAARSRSPDEAPFMAWPADRQAHRPLASGTPLDPSRADPKSTRSANQLDKPAPDSQPALPTRIARQPLTVHHNSFELPYAQQPVGPGGLPKVELWGTSDAGRSWTYYGTDVDGRSPFHVTVPQPGLYGFLIRLHPPAGAQPPDPQPGDLPDLWVEVEEH